MEENGAIEVKYFGGNVWLWFERVKKVVSGMLTTYNYILQRLYAHVELAADLAEIENIDDPDVRSDPIYHIDLKVDFQVKFVCLVPVWLR